MRVRGPERSSVAVAARETQETEGGGSTSNLLPLHFHPPPYSHQPRSLQDPLPNPAPAEPCSLAAPFPSRLAFSRHVTILAAQSPPLLVLFLLPGPPPVFSNHHNPGPLGHVPPPAPTPGRAGHALLRGPGAPCSSPWPSVLDTWRVNQILQGGGSRRSRGLPTPRSLAWGALRRQHPPMVPSSSCPAGVGLGLRVGGAAPKL